MTDDARLNPDPDPGRTGDRPVDPSAGEVQARAEQVTTYTPMVWATLSDDERYAEYIRVRTRVEALESERGWFGEIEQAGKYCLTNQHREKLEALRERAEAAEALLKKREAELDEWHTQLGDGPPSYHSAGIELLKGDLSAWITRAEAAESQVHALTAQLAETDALLKELWACECSGWAEDFPDRLDALGGFSAPQRPKGEQG